MVGIGVGFFVNLLVLIFFSHYNITSDIVLTELCDSDQRGKLRYVRGFVHEKKVTLKTVVVVVFIIFYLFIFYFLLFFYFLLLLIL